MANSPNVALRQGEPFRHHGVAVTFDPSLFGLIDVAAPNAGIKQATCRQQNAGGAIAGGHGTGQDAKRPTGFFASHCPERF